MLDPLVFSIYFFIVDPIMFVDKYKRGRFIITYWRLEDLETCLYKTRSDSIWKKDCPTSK